LAVAGPAIPSRFVRPAVIAGLAIFALLCATSLTRKSSTWDETVLLGTGYPLLTERDWDVASAQLHPPLTYYVHSLPLFFLDLDEEAWSLPGGIARGQRLIASRADDRVLDSARLAMLPFGLGVVLVVALWARRLYGNAGLFAALPLAALSPNLIAHARLITIDTALTFFSVLTLFLLARAGAMDTKRRRLALGVVLGLFLLTKYTALLLVGIFLIVDLTVVVARAARSGSGLRAGMLRAGAWLHCGVVAFLVMWAGYQFDVGPLQRGDALSFPVPMPAFFDGVLYQLAQSRQEHDFFFLGSYSTAGWWYFYPVAYAIKLPLGTLALLGALPLLWLWKRLPPVREELYLLLPLVLFLFYMSFFNTIHNGIRYLLPVYPLALVLAGKLPRLIGRPLLASLVPAAGALVTAVGVLSAWPDYLPYVNALFGGPSRAYRLLGDSNVDWGQDLEQLGDYLRENEVDRVGLAYFGTADPAHYGIVYEYMPSPNSALRRGGGKPAEETPSLVALSAYQYQGIAFPNKDFYAKYHRYRPNAQIGHSILLFDRNNLIPREGDAE
jgi:4-amino-4-deoxy-L-arabinose transferase-like glycosyltransferase